MSTTVAPPARLKARYSEEILPALMGRFGYSSVMQAPRLEKITLNMGVGMAKQDSKVLKAAQEQLATIAGQQPSIRRGRKSIAAFKLREGMPVGVAVTLRGERSYEFLDRLVSIAIPRIRDFRGLNPRSFDGRGNYSLGVREQIIFPEIDYDAIDQVRGLDITITTTAKTDVEAFALLSALGLPFATRGRPAGFDLPGEGPQEDESDGASPEAAAAEPEPQPAAAEPEAAAAETEPAAAETEPAAAETEPSALEPESTAAENVEEPVAEIAVEEPEGVGETAEAASEEAGETVTEETAEASPEVSAEETGADSGPQDEAGADVEAAEDKETADQEGSD